MELKEGYKRSDIGVFPNDWEITSYTTFGQVIDGDRGKNYPSSIDLKSNGYCLFLNAGNVTKEGFKFNNCEFITQVKDKKLNKGKLNFGDCILTTRGTVGNIAFFTSDVPFEHMRINSGMVILRNNSKALLNSYQYYLFKSGIVGAQLNQLSFGSAQPQLTVKGIKTIQLPLPNIPEQKAIAEVLSDTDAYIESLAQLIEKKSLIMQGVIHELLTGKQRLPGFTNRWVGRKLGSFTKIIKGKGLAKNLVEKDAKLKCILYGELFTTYKRVIKEVLNSTNSSEGVKSEFGDVLMPGSTTTKGIDLATASALHISDVRLGGDINIIRKYNTYPYSPVFLAYYLSHILKQAIEEISQGITIYHLYGKDLAELFLMIPNIDEQIEITRIIEDMDTEIAALEQKLSKAKQIKLGLIQELLTGKIRLI